MPAREVPYWVRRLPFWFVHVAALIGAIWVGWSWQACAWLLGGYAVRMFAVTAGFHRYFAHRSYKTSRAFQLVLAVLGMSAAQQGPIWWASHHRRHHKHSDEPGDTHSPRQGGLWWAHIGWVLSNKWEKTEHELVPDLARYPELRWVDGHDAVFVIGYGILLYLLGGPTALIWGHFVAMVACWHVTFCINSLAHVWGRQRYATGDESRNNALLAVLTFGEGWHNNHHYYQRSARQGFYWWQIDISFYVLKLLEVVHLVRDVEGVPAHVRDVVTPVPVLVPAVVAKL